MLTQRDSNHAASWNSNANGASDWYFRVDPTCNQNTKGLVDLDATLANSNSARSWGHKAGLCCLWNTKGHLRWLWRHRLRGKRTIAKGFFQEPCWKVLLDRQSGIECLLPASMLWECRSLLCRDTWVKRLHGLVIRREPDLHRSSCRHL